MNWVDPILLSVLFLFALRGYFKGLFRETFSIGGLVVGFMAAVRYDQPVATWAAVYSNVPPVVLKGAAFVALFFFVYFIFALIGWLLHQCEKILFLHTLNRLGGIVVGLGKGTAIAALLVFVASSNAFVSRSTRERLEDSYLARPLSELGQGLIRLGKEKLFPKHGDQARAQPGLSVA